jgi:hypothetical protein
MANAYSHEAMCSLSAASASASSAFSASITDALNQRLQTQPRASGAAEVDRDDVPRRSAGRSIR